MNTKILHLAIIASGCVAAVPAYAVPAVTRAITRPEIVRHDFKLVAERHKGDESSRQVVASMPNFKVSPAYMSSWEPKTSATDVDRDSTPAAAPEVDPGVAAGALTLLAGALALLADRRQKGRTVSSC